MTHKFQREAEGSNEIGGGGNGEQKMSAVDFYELHFRGDCHTQLPEWATTFAEAYSSYCLYRYAAQFAASAPDDQWTAPYQPTEKRGEFALQSQQPKASASAPTQGGISTEELQAAISDFLRPLFPEIPKENCSDPFDYEGRNTLNREKRNCILFGMTEILSNPATYGLSTLPKGEVEQKAEACPFCGVDPVVVTQGDHSLLRCPNCGAAANYFEDHPADQGKEEQK